VMAPAADQWQDFVSGLKSANVIDVVAEPVGTQEPAGQKVASLPEMPTDPALADVVSASASSTTSHN
jgi:hypothetical protein